MGIVVMWLPLTASSRPLSGLRCTDVVLWSLTGNKELVVSRFGDAVTIIAGAYRTARMYVSDGTEARIVRCALPEVVSSCVEVPSSFAKVPSSFAKVPSSFAGMCSRRGGVLPRLAGTMAVGRSRGLDVNGMGSAVRGMGSAVRGMCLAVRGMGSAACLADWGEQKSSSEELLLMGGRWDSNPRHSEPQSDALTN